MFERLLSKVCQSLDSQIQVQGKAEHSRALLFLKRAPSIFRNMVMSALAAILFTSGFASAQTVRSEATILSDAKSFMASYAEDLLAGKRDVIVEAVF